ncbi:hypothetical protein F2Q69_00046485 [Brassica cretica]|uniref:Uncharacterized protein n=1 Tax=Brassica cretica TaxID=69181 RepID=A0A8S9PY02_BRACR|nr:hypothetical protein F2Q69_00046485 [Brassica cretica]
MLAEEKVCWLRRNPAFEVMMSGLQRKSCKEKSPQQTVSQFPFKYSLNNFEEFVSVQEQLDIRCKDHIKTTRDLPHPKRRLLQFDVQEICDNFEKRMMKALKDISKSHKKSTSTRAPIAEPSLFISEKPKGKSETHVEEFKNFSDSLPIFDESDEEPIESLMTCENKCDLPSLEPEFVTDIEQDIVELTILQPEHPSSLVLSPQPEIWRSFVVQTGYLRDASDRGSVQNGYLNIQKVFCHESNFTGKPTQQGFTEAWNNLKIFTGEGVMNFPNRRFSSPSIHEYQTSKGDSGPRKKRPEPKTILHEPKVFPQSTSCPNQKHYLTLSLSFPNRFTAWPNFKIDKQIFGDQFTCLMLAHVLDDYPKSLDHVFDVLRIGKPFDYFFIRFDVVSLVVLNEHDKHDHFPRRASNDTDHVVYWTVPHTSRKELWLEPWPDDRSDRTGACLSCPTSQAKAEGQARINLGRANSDSDHSFSLLACLARTACTSDCADDLAALFDPIMDFSFGYFSKARILKLSEDLGHVGTRLVRSERPAALVDRPAHVLILSALDTTSSDESGTEQSS